MHVKLKDTVVLLSGKDAGAKGEVIALDRAKGRVKVERRNMMTKHQKPNPVTGAEGSRVKRENWIDASNVALFNEKLGHGERTSNRYVGKDGELFSSKPQAKASFGDAAPAVIQKVRVGKKSQHVYDAKAEPSAED